MTGDIEDWWDRRSKDYQDECQIPVDIHYGPSSPNEDELNLLGDVEGRGRRRRRRASPKRRLLRRHRDPRRDRHRPRPSRPRPGHPVPTLRRLGSRRRRQAVAQADRRIQFAGTIPFSVLRKSAKDYLGQLVCTNFVGHGKIHKLVDIHFLDGFDDRGEYIAPHFMNERTVLTLRADEPGWLKTLEYLRKNQHARSGENGYRFQVVVRMHQRWLQETGFFDAEVQQMAVFDDHNRLVEYLGPQPGESE